MTRFILPFLLLFASCAALAQDPTEKTGYWLGSRGPYQTGTRFLEWSAFPQAA